MAHPLRFNSWRLSNLDGEARGRVPLLDAGVARRIAQVTDKEEAHSGETTDRKSVV